MGSDSHFPRRKSFAAVVCTSCPTGRRTKSPRDFHSPLPLDPLSTDGHARRPVRPRGRLAFSAPSFRPVSPLPTRPDRWGPPLEPVGKSSANRPPIPPRNVQIIQPRRSAIAINSAVVAHRKSSRILWSCICNVCRRMQNFSATSEIVSPSLNRYKISTSRSVGCGSASMRRPRGGFSGNCWMQAKRRSFPRAMTRKLGRWNCRAGRAGSWQRVCPEQRALTAPVHLCPIAQ